MGDPDRGRVVVLRPRLRLVDLSPLVLPDERNHVLVERFSVSSMALTDLRVPRQEVLIGAGLALVASVLAACTTYGKKPEASGDTATTTKAPPTTGGTAPELINVIAKTADVPVGSGVIVGEIV